MNKFIKCTLFFILVSLFISSKVSADSPDDFLKRKEISIDSTFNIEVFLEQSKNTTGDSMMPIIFTENQSKYIKISDYNFFRVIDSSVELISTKPESKAVLWRKDFNDLFLPKILIKNNYLIVSGEFFSYDFDLFNELNLSKPISVIKVFDISNLDQILLSNEFMLPGSFKDCISVEDSVILLTDFLTGADSYARFPYYIEDNQRESFSLDNLMKLSNSDSKSYINLLKVSLNDSPKVIDYKSLLGFGNTISFSNENLFIRYFENDVTRISKFNLTGDWMRDNYSISVPGVINSDNSFNIFNGNIKLVTSVLENDKSTFNVYSLDENLNLKDSFVKFGNGFIQNVYPIKNNLLLNYSNSSENYQDNWINFHFNEDYSLRTLPLDNFKYSNSFFTNDYVFSFENRDSSKSELIIRDNNLEIINTLSVNNDNFIFPSGNTISCAPDNKNLVIPIVLNTSNKMHGMLVFKNYTTDSPSMYLVHDIDLENTIYSISETPEYLEFQGNKLYAFSQDSIFVYNLSTNKLESKISLK